MILTKEEFFKYDYVMVTDIGITFIKDNVTTQENFVVRKDAIKITLDFLREAENEGWIELFNWKSDPIQAMFRIIKKEDTTPPVSPTCPSCNYNLLKVDQGYRCLNCGYVSW